MKKCNRAGERNSWAIRAMTVMMCGMICASCGDTEQSGSAPGAAAAASPPPGVSGLGRIEPGDGVVSVAARAPMGPPIVARLVVGRGDMVKAGQVLAELDNKAELEADLRLAASRTEVARSRLAQARAGAEASEVAAQEAEIQRLETELNNARTEHKRYASLGTNVTAEELDRLKLRIESTTSSLAAARQRLASLTEVRGVDVNVAQAELEEAIRAEARARLDAKTSVILAPIDGRVIEIHAWPGEQVGPEGLLELAPTQPMYAVAEITESDIARIRVGQRATITGDGLDEPLEGTVERISPKVLQNEIMPVNPTNFSDSRVVEVWIKIDDGKAVADRIHMRVDVVIQT